MIGVPKRDGFGEAQAWAPREEKREGAFHFQPGQGGAETEVKPTAKGGMGRTFAGRVETVRVWPDSGVAVGCTEKKLHLIALGKVMAKEADIFLCDAGEDMQRRVMAQDFLDDRGATVGSGVDLGGQEQRHAITVLCTVASCPAFNSKMQVEIISGKDRRAPSSSAAMSWVIRSSAGAARRRWM